jgi:hypothetical protein
MRIGRVIIIPTILALTVAGSTLAASATPAAAAHMNNIHLLAQAPASVVSGMYYHS